MKIGAQRESDSIVNRPTTKPHCHGVVSSMLPHRSFSIPLESLQKLWLRVSIFKTTNETNAKLPSRKRIRDIKTYSDCQQRTDPNKTVISPHLECVLPRKILETDRGKSILKNLASSLSIIIQSNVESKLLRRPIIVPLPFFPSEMNQ